MSFAPEVSRYSKYLAFEIGFLPHSADRTPVVSCCATRNLSATAAAWERSDRLVRYQCLRHRHAPTTCARWSKRSPELQSTRMPALAFLVAASQRW